MILTRILEIRYLWIDALCIVQDDEDDWVREAALMANVYGSAVLNIAAHTACDAQHGFLPSKGLFTSRESVLILWNRPDTLSRLRGCLPLHILMF